MLSVLLSALCPPAPLKSLTFWRYTNQIIIIIIIITDRTGQTDRQRSDSIGRTVLQTVAQKQELIRR